MGGEPERDKEKAREKEKDREKEKERPKAPSATKERERDKDREREKNSKDAEASKDKGKKVDRVDKGAPGAPAAASQPAAARPAKTVSKSSADQGLSDEVLTQLAQVRFDMQEDRLRDVARHTMVLLRDFHKSGVADFAKKATEVQKVLLKYETQYIRAWEYQERRRRREVEDLGVEASRCRIEAEEEGAKIVELHEILEKEKQRRKRYERYEDLAETVCRKKARAKSQAEIDDCRTEIAETRKKRKEMEAFVEQRHLRAQLLSHAVAELRGDLKREQALFAQASVAGVPETVLEPTGSPDQDSVEVIS